MSASQGLMVNRLLVLLQIVFFPVYFIIYAIWWFDPIFQSFQTFFRNEYGILFLSISFEWMNLGDTFLTSLIYFGIPIFYSFPWVVVSVLRANKIANSYDLMGRALGRVRIDQKLFYGLNASFAFIFFVLPIASPMITIFGIFYGIRLIFMKIKIGKISFLIWFIPALLVAFFPILMAAGFYSEYSELWTDVFGLWSDYIDVVFGIGLCLAIAIAIGNFILLNQEGAKQYGNRSEVNYELVLGLKIFMFVLFLFLYFADPAHTVIYYINIIALVLGVSSILIRFFRKVESPGESGFGFVMIPIFSIVNFLSSQFARSFVIFAASLIFVGLFVISYRYSEDEDLFT